MRKLSIKQARSLITSNAGLMELGEFLLEQGYNRKQVAALIAEAADDAVDWTKVVQGPAGAALEAADRAVVYAAALLVMPLLERKVEQARDAIQARVD